jgi:hypothetical protein
MDLVAIVEIAVVPMPPASHDRAARTRMKTAASLIEGGRAIVRSAEGPADQYAGVTDRGAGPLWGAGGGSSSTPTAVAHLCFSGGNGSDGLIAYFIVFMFVEGDVIADILVFTYTFTLWNREVGGSIPVDERGTQDGFHIHCLHRGKGTQDSFHVLYIFGLE